MATDGRIEEIRSKLAVVEDPIALLVGLFAYSPVGFQVYRADGHSLLVNPAFRALFGREPPPQYNVLEDEVAARTGHAERIRRAFTGAVVTLPPVWYDARELKRTRVEEGRHVAIVATFFPIYDRGGRVTHVAAVFKDETAETLAREQADAERARAEAERARAEAERTQTQAERDVLQAIIAQSGDGIIVADASGVVRVLNAEAARQHGVPGAAVPASRWAEAFALRTVEGEPLPLAATALARALAGERVEHARWRVQRPDGSERVLAGTATPLVAPTGAPAGAVLVTRDETERLALEAELRRSRDDLRAILEGVDEGIIAEDPSGRLVFANDAAARLTDHPTAETLLAAGSAAFERFDIDGDDEAAGSWRAAEARGERLARIRRPGGGELRWVRVRSRAVRDEGGHPQLLLTIFQDVTERKRDADAERFLAEAGAVLAASLDASGPARALEALRAVARLSVPLVADGCVVDLPGDRRLVIYEDPAGESLLGEVLAARSDGDHPVAWAIRERRPLLIHDLDPARFPATDRDALVALGLRSLLVVPLVARGRVLGTMTVVTGASGRRLGPRDFGLVQEVAGRAAVVVDNARLFREAHEARLRAEALAAELSSHHRWLEALLDRIPTPVLLVEPRTGRVTFGNEAAAALVGGAPGEDYLERFTWTDAAGAPVPPEQHPAARAAAGEALRGVELDWQLPSGKRSILFRSEELPALFGRPATLVVTLEDVTRLKRTERELQEAVRARDAFLSIAAHELKTPLTSLQLQTQGLLRRGRRERIADWVKEKLEAMDRSVDRLTVLIAELLDVSRITAGALRLELEDVDLDAVVAEVASRFTEELVQAGCELRLHPSSDPPLRGRWDRARLDHVVTNLLSNAIKYGGCKPIEVTVERVAPDRARLRVADEGIGIPSEAQPRVFERFERFASGHHYGGLGLGLWIVRQLVQALGGEVRVESEVGVGSTFTVDLPLAGPPGARPEDETDRRAGGEARGDGGDDGRRGDRRDGTTPAR